MTCAKDIVDKTLELPSGCDYVEVRYERTLSRSYRFRNGLLERASRTMFEGVGIRVLSQGVISFTSTNVLSLDRIRECVNDVVKSCKLLSALRLRRASLSQERPARLKYSVISREPIGDLDDQHVIRFCRELDERLRVSDRVKVRMLYVDLEETYKIVKTSEGGHVESYIPRIFIGYHMVLHDSERVSVTRFVEFGFSGGWELVRENKVEDVMVEETRIALEVLEKARPLPHDDVMDVIFGPELAGIMVHESVGHPIELDRIMGREGAEAGESYIRPEDIGSLRIGSEHVTIIDDPTIPNSYGYYLADDECVQARPRYLVRNGVITEPLTNREYASYLGIRSTAAARSMSYQVEPIPRMANTYLAPGSWKVDEIISDTRRGLYVRSYNEWNIDDRRWFMRYGGHECYYVENGEIKYMVRNPFIEVNTRDLWSSVDAVANDLKFYPGFCGKGNPVQTVPVWLGGCTFRARNVRVLKAP